LRREILRARAAPGLGSETIDIITKNATTATKTRSKAVVKEYAPHEHFGSPLNVCRICGEKYTYVPKPYSPLAKN
jgi:hypothetical protein